MPSKSEMDLRDYDTIKNAVDDVDVVIHLAAMLDRWDVAEKDLYETNYTGTLNLLKASENVSQFIFCSTCGVFFLTNYYDFTKKKAEQAVMEHGVPFTIIRPEFVYGEDDTRIMMLIDAINAGKFYYINGGRSFLRPTYVEDVVKGIVLCIGNKDSINKDYNIVGDRPVSVKELVLMIGNYLGKDSDFASIPRNVAMTGAFISEAFGKLFKRKPLLRATTVELFSVSRYCDYEKAEKELGYFPTVTVEEGMRRTVEHYLHNRSLKE